MRIASLMLSIAVVSFSLFLLFAQSVCWTDTPIYRHTYRQRVVAFSGPVTRGKVIPRSGETNVPPSCDYMR